MKTITISKLTLTCFVMMSLLTVSANGQKKTRRSPAKQSAAGYQDLLKDFDTKAEKLPPNYKGHSPVAMYELLKQLHPVKGEYETSEKFNQRLDGLQRVITSHIYAFRIEDATSPVREYIDNIATAYDADSQKLKVKVGVYPTSEDGQIVNLKNFSRRSSTIGRNAFGVRKRISTLAGIGYNLLFWSKKKPEIAIEMPPEKAQRIRPSIAILIVCQLTIPSDQNWPILSTMIEKEATMTEPEATAFEARVITTYVYSVWVVNKATGEVLAKIDMEEEDQKDK